jgi:hypothetical protein
MRFSPTRSTLFAVAGVLLASALLAQAPGDTVPNWTVPPYRASGGSGGITTMVDISDAAIFVAVTPCRVFDTRNAVGPYGGPRLAANVARVFDVDGGPCTGIPAGAASFSMTFGAILPDDDGFLTVWPGGALPVVSSMNFVFGEVIANAAIVPASAAGAISVLASQGTHLYGDINGYFMDSGGDLNDNTTLFVDGSDAGEGTITGVNRDATSTSSTMSGVRGLITTAMSGPAAILAQNTGDGGTNYALRAQNDSGGNDSAGILGTSNLDDDPVSCGAPPCFGDAGVRGVAGSFGVLGIANFGGVAGVLYSDAGVELAQGRLGSSIGTDPSPGAAPPWGVFSFGDIGAVGAKYFLDPHPSDPSKMIAYVALEGPEAGTYFRGRGKFERGMARISVPEDFRLVTDSEGLTVQITPIGGMATVGVMSLNLNEIVVQSSRNVEFSYLVQGVRATYKDLTPIRSGSAFAPERSSSKMPAWLSEGQKRILIQNGTFREDGSINMETAERLGWDRVWAERERPTPRPAAP